MRRVRVVLPLGRVLVMVGVSALVAALHSGLTFAQAAPQDVWSGVYNDAQAERGKTVYTTGCVRCHAADLKGYTAPALSGEPFMANWEAESLGGLYRKIRDTMPPNVGGARIPDESKVDIVAYILKTNGFPAGPAEMTIDEEALDRTLIARKSGLSSVPNFSTVSVVGCITQTANRAWTLTDATEPAMASGDGAAPSVGSAALGSQVFELVSASRFKPEEQIGRTVEATGLLYDDGSLKMINVTSLRTLAPTCGPR